MGRIHQTDAIVLSRTDVGEEDSIHTFLTRDFGLLRAAAGGARNLGKGQTGRLDLFVLSNVRFFVSDKPGKLCRIRAVDVVESHLGIREDFMRLCVASAMAELVAHCIQEADPVPAVFELLTICLGLLGAGAGPVRVLLIFEMRFLKELGLAPELSRCLVCGREITGKSFISPPKGGLLHPECSSGAGNEELTYGDLATLRFIAEKPMDSIGRLSIADGSAGRIFGELNRFSVHHLGFETKSLRVLLRKGQ